MYYKNMTHRAVMWSGGATVVANKLGVSSSAIYDWINRGYVPRLEKAKALAKLANFELRLIRFPNEPRNPYRSAYALRHMSGPASH